MAGGSRFVARIALEGILNLRIDTPIQLQSTVRQMAFNGMVTDQRLKRVLHQNDGLTIAAVKIILGKGFLEDGELYGVDTSIASRFLALVLDSGMPKEEAELLMSKLFKVELLGGLKETINAAFSSIGVPRPKDIPLLQDPDEVVKLYPYLLDLKGLALLEHREKVEKGIIFLKKMLQVDAAYGQLEWVREFQDFCSWS